MGQLIAESNLSMMYNPGLKTTNPLPFGKPCVQRVILNQNKAKKCLNCSYFKTF